LIAPAKSAFNENSVSITQNANEMTIGGMTIQFHGSRRHCEEGGDNSPNPSLVEPEQREIASVDFVGQYLCNKITGDYEEDIDADKPPVT